MFHLYKWAEALGFILTSLIITKILLRLSGFKGGNHADKHQIMSLNSVCSIASVQDAPLTFPLTDECCPPVPHLSAQIFHHAVNAVVQHQRASLRHNGLPADGTLVSASPPVCDTVLTETVSTAQCHRLREEEKMYTAY